MTSTSGPLPPNVTTRQTELLLATWITFTLALLSVFFRYISRHISRAKLWWDDYLILFPLALSILECTWTTIVAKSYGFGLHIQYTQPGVITFFLKYLYGYQIVYTLWLSAVKYSIVLLLWRIFAVPFPHFRKALWAVTALITGWCIAILFTSIFSCVPAKAFWGAAEGKCVPSNHFFLGNAIPNIITDVILIILPIPYLLRLKVVFSQKLAIVGIFIVGSFIVAVSIIRLSYLMAFNDEQDLTYTDVPVVTWTNIEGNCAIVAACLPSMGPLLVASIRMFNGTRIPPTPEVYSAHNSRSGGGWIGNYKRSAQVTVEDQELGDFVHLQNSSPSHSGPESPNIHITDADHGKGMKGPTVETRRVSGSSH